MSPPSHAAPAAGSIRAVGIIARTGLSDVATVVTDISTWLDRRGVSALVDSQTAELARLDASHACADADIPSAVDLLLALGGDGTLLRVAGLAARAGVDVPILAVNFGSLGFLTEITLPELYAGLQSALDGSARVDDRQMLYSQVIRDGAVLAERTVLNDVVVAKAALSNIIELEITVGDQFVTNCRADGLIIASPTGSTAYNLAAGGPIVHPRVDALIVTPIAAHTLSNRPIVIPSGAPVQARLLIGAKPSAAAVSFDGQFGHALTPADVVTVQGAAQPLRMIRAEQRSYFAVLRAKLGWGGGH